MKTNRNLVDINGKVYSTKDRSNGLDFKIKKDIWNTVLWELAPESSQNLSKSKFPKIALVDRYDYSTDICLTQEDFIKVYAPSIEKLDFAKHVAEKFNISITSPIKSKDYEIARFPNRVYSVVVQVTSNIENTK